MEILYKWNHTCSSNTCFTLKSHSQKIKINKTSHSHFPNQYVVIILFNKCLRFQTMYMLWFILPFPYWWTFTLFPIFPIIVIILKHYVWISLENILKVLKISWKERSYLKTVTTLIWTSTDLIHVPAWIMAYWILPRVRQFWVYAPDYNLLAFQMEVCNIDTACYPPRRLLTQRGDYFSFFHMSKAFPFELFCQWMSILNK